MSNPLIPPPLAGGGQGGSVLALAALSADPRHVGAVAADRLATLLACSASLGRRKLMRGPTLVGDTSTLGGNLSLALLTHAGKAAPATR